MLWALSALPFVRPQTLSDVKDLLRLLSDVEESASDNHSPIRHVMSHSVIGPSQVR